MLNLFQHPLRRRTRPARKWVLNQVQDDRSALRVSRVGHVRERTVERLLGLLEPLHQDAHRLTGHELEPQEPRVAEHDEEPVAHAPGEGESREVDLGLVPGRRLKADDRLDRGPAGSGARRP